MFQSCDHCCLLLHSTKAKTWTEFGIIFICTLLKQVAYKFTETYSTWLSQDWGSGFPLVEGLGDSPTTWKIGLSPIPLLCPKKHCFCNFHAVFGDFGQDLHPTEGSLVGNPGVIPIVMNRTSPTSSHSNITWVEP